MDNLQKNGLKLGFFSLMLLVVILGVYFVNDVSSGNSQNVITKASQNSDGLTIVYPKNGEAIKGKGFIEARFKSNKDIKNLKGIFKIGDGPTLPLNLKSLDAENISITGEFDTQDYSEGLYSIKMYLYNTENNKVTAIANADFSTNISPF